MTEEEEKRLFPKGFSPRHVLYIDGKPFKDFPTAARHYKVSQAVLLGMLYELSPYHFRLRSWGSQ